MFDLVIACFLGIGCGTVTGMIPGIHVNTAGAIMFASSAFLLKFISPEFLCVVFVAMSIAQLNKAVGMSSSLFEWNRTKIICFHSLFGN